MDEELVCILLYADDIALIAPCAEGLQEMLDKLNEWCIRWKMLVNAKKTQVIHFRKGPSITRSDFQFKCGEACIETVDRYRYLGLIFTEFLDFNIMAKTVAQAAARALGLLIAKCKAHGGVPHEVFTKLYDSLVQPIIDYGAAVWGATEFSCIHAVQHRACRYFLGLGKYAPNGACGVAPQVFTVQQKYKVCMSNRSMG